ncbi:hypothetical protein HDF16_005710 [Granulicella aggregans]|uniref:Uncharacterized protein n=1 Tax=Granulicella aggregans TaxID=474949 RepID=A0A7W7ZK11_9BACT|nr:hypothetical protein [Granulicella aggregans]
MRVSRPVSWAIEVAANTGGLNRSLQHWLGVE